jgi:lysozyme
LAYLAPHLLENPLAFTRVKLTALSLSASALVGLAVHEGYRGEAYIPVPGDRPTIGFGSTFNEDGTPVRMGDKITPERALVRTLRDVEKFEGAIKQCVTVPLYQHEYDVAVSFSYNVGARAFCNSTLVRKWNAGDYEGGCNELTRWVFVNGKKIQGLVNRREEERKKCLGIKTQ